MRYEAFISYSHRDKTAARRLQNALENYRLPRALRLTPDRPGRRLRPVFRDDTELASSDDLTASIIQAMKESAALIVVCSPRATASRWTNEEIRVFRRVAPGRPILPLIIDGSPERAAPDCAFPEALLCDEHGAELPEPLAADLRPEADGRRGALLKLVAGLLGVGVDALRQRDQQRRLRAMGAITAGALVISLVTLTLAVIAERARDEADLRRGQAESLIDFMLVDLRARLEPIGRLDLLDDVGEQAGEYFQALGTLGSDEELLARALSLRQLGEVQFARRDLPAALEAFEDSRELTAALLDRHPSQAEYRFEQSQAEFWVGYVAWESDDLAGAERSFTAYHDHSRNLLEAEPDNADYQLEMVYALNNLGALARARGQPNVALTHIQQANALNERLLLADQADDTLRYELAQGYSWEGSALLDRGELAAADRVFSRGAELMKALWENGEDMRRGEEYAYLLGIHANLKWHRGEVNAADDLLGVCEMTFRRLIEHDPSNDSWIRGHHRCTLWLAETGLHLGRYDDSRRQVNDTLVALETATSGAGDDLELAAIQALGLCMSARLHLVAGQAEKARDDARECERLRSDTVGRGGAGVQLALARDLAGEAEFALGHPDRARARWQAATLALDRQQERTPKARALRLKLQWRLGEADDPGAHRQALHDMGFADPRYLPTSGALAGTGS